MAKIRYVRDNSTPQAAPAGLNNTVRSVRAIYETDPEIAAAVLPRPLVLGDRPTIFVQFAHVAMHVSPENTIEIGAATVGVNATYEGKQGWYVLAMPMEGDFVVIGGRETFGEPKKIAKVDFNVTDTEFSTSVTRHGIPFLELRGTIGESTGPAQFEENLFCYKGMPAIDKSDSFDGDCFLTQLDWERDYTDVRKCDGEVILRESAHDPLIDIPVRKLISMEYCEGASVTGGKILTKVPGEWLVDHWHQRFDNTNVPALDIPVAAQAAE